MYNIQIATQMGLLVQITRQSCLLPCRRELSQSRLQRQGAFQTVHTSMCSKVTRLQSSILLLWLHEKQRHAYLNGSLHLLDEDISASESGCDFWWARARHLSFTGVSCSNHLAGAVNSALRAVGSCRTASFSQAGSTGIFPCSQTTAASSRTRLTRQMPGHLHVDAACHLCSAAWQPLGPCRLSSETCEMLCKLNVAAKQTPGGYPNHQHKQCTLHADESNMPQLPQTTSVQSRNCSTSCRVALPRCA